MAVQQMFFRGRGPTNARFIWSAVGISSITENADTLSGDVQLLISEVSGESVDSSALSGWTLLADLADPPDATGSRMRSYYRIRGAGAPGAIANVPGTDHRVFAVLNFRGVNTSNPIGTQTSPNGSAPLVDPTSGGMSVSTPGIAVFYGTRSDDSVSGFITSIASTTTTDAAERVDSGTSSGNGGGVFALTGYMAAAGVALMTVNQSRFPANGIAASVFFREA